MTESHLQHASYLVEFSFLRYLSSEESPAACSKSFRCQHIWTVGHNHSLWTEWNDSFIRKPSDTSFNGTLSLPAILSKCKIKNNQWERREEHMLKKTMSPASPWKLSRVVELWSESHRTLDWLKSNWRIWVGHSFDKRRRGIKHGSFE